jgi:transcriptional regulator with XRE-family HTH domain
VIIIRYDDIYDRISELCDERGWSDDKLINESGIEKDIFNKLIEQKSVPKMDLIQKICDGFNISLGEFFSDNLGDKELSKSEMCIVAKSRKLNGSDRRRVLAYMQSLIDG